jgi:hypothetical protein
MYFLRVLLFYFLCIFHHSFSKILIFTYAYNRPDFIELQQKMFKKFMEEEYEFVVFNDATNNNMKIEIENMCSALGLRCVRIPPEIHERPYLARPSHGNFAAKQQGSVRNCNVVQYSLNEIGFKHDDIVMLFDSDMFLIKAFSVREYMQGYDLAGYKRMCYDFFHNCDRDHRGRPAFGYLWIGIVFLNMATMPNKNTIDFNCGFVDGGEVDSGGFTYNYIKNNPSARIRYFNRIRLPELLCSECMQNKIACIHNTSLLREKGFNQADIEFLQHAPMFEIPLPVDWFSEYYLDAYFLHFRGASRDELYAKKEGYVLPFLSRLLNSN